jgi:hypothetical protein
MPKKFENHQKKILNHLASQLKHFEPPLHALLNYKAKKDHG